MKSKNVKVDLLRSGFVESDKVKTKNENPNQERDVLHKFESRYKYK